MQVIEAIKEKARREKRRIVLPESGEERILRAACQASAEGVAEPILIGNEREVGAQAGKLGVSLGGIAIEDPSASDRLDPYVREYLKIRSGKEVTEALARRILLKNLYYGAMMVRVGDADGMVAGAATLTASVIKAGHLIIGFQEGIGTPSSFFVMETGNPEVGEGGVLIYADAAVNPDPDPEQLADIAISSARSARALLGWEPRVAILSFSTKGSASHPLVDKVIKAAEIAKAKAPSLLIDGELQADAALKADVARKKMKDPGPVAGRANVLIFPDLNSGNISYKLTQHVGGARAYGPILQGFAKPISDLSRGARSEEIAGVIAIVSVLAQSILPESGQGK
ncbi:MAG: phosphate acetyltransferase [Candidatus Brockarchaeota archaeon]|nr:phosphate acetyltransferase [Candidatus Brockarchaeota archaeon]